MEDKIEVGEYVRTKKGQIDKIDRYIFESNIYHCENGMCIDSENKIGVHFEDIVKHSKNIIDLIEVGDIVKYNLRGLAVTRVAVVKKYKDAKNGKEYLIVEGYSLEQVKILEILAKEQFKYNCYEVKEA